MRQDELNATFDQQATSYDAQWERLAPVRDALYWLTASLFAKLPEDARILCVGVGTGAELAYLAHRFPHGHFTALEPSGAMLERCRRRAEEEGFAARCTFFGGYVGALPVTDKHDGATCFLVSQFILESDERAAFFRTIADRLKPGGLLVSADLAAGPDAFETLLHAWLTLMTGSEVSDARLERARAAYAKDLAILDPASVAAILGAGGFESPVQVFQAGLMHAWRARRLPEFNA